jgi:hypothetical protein
MKMNYNFIVGCPSRQLDPLKNHWALSLIEKFSFGIARSSNGRSTTMCEAGREWLAGRIMK